MNLLYFQRAVRPQMTHLKKSFYYWICQFTDLQKLFFFAIRLLSLALLVTMACISVTNFLISSDLTLKATEHGCYSIK